MRIKDIIGVLSLTLVLLYSGIWVNTYAGAQDKPNTNIPISCQEKVELLEAQVDRLAAMLAQNQSEKTVELKSFSVDQRVSALFTSYGFTRADHVLCHGPNDAPECVGAPEHDIVFRKKDIKVKK